MAAMKCAICAVLAAVTVQGTSILRGSAEVQGCGPQTKVCIADFANAAGDPQWECTAASSGAQVSIKKVASKHGGKICGPGKFHFSPMTCAGGRFEYKKTAHEVNKDVVTTGCQVVPFPYDMACYSVEC